MDATLVLTKNDIIYVEVALQKLLKWYGATEKIKLLSHDDQIKKLHRKYLREYPDNRIDPVCFLGYDSGYAMYLSAYMPPAYDFWMTAIIVTDNELSRLYKSTKIRTEILGSTDELKALIIRNNNLVAPIQYDTTITSNILRL